MAPPRRRWRTNSAPRSMRMSSSRFLRKELSRSHRYVIRFVSPTDESVLPKFHLLPLLMGREEYLGCVVLWSWLGTSFASLVFPGRWLAVAIWAGLWDTDLETPLDRLGEDQTDMEKATGLQANARWQPTLMIDTVGSKANVSHKDGGTPRKHQRLDRLIGWALDTQRQRIPRIMRNFMTLRRLEEVLSSRPERGR